MLPTTFPFIHEVLFSSREGKLQKVLSFLPRMKFDKFVAQDPANDTTCNFSFYFVYPLNLKK
jgi:hypothetical protein